MDCLTAMFPGRFISRFGHIAWPATPPDLSAPDYFLWRHLKVRVYVNKPGKIREMRSEKRMIDKRLYGTVWVTCMTGKKEQEVQGLKSKTHTHTHI